MNATEFVKKIQTENIEELISTYEDMLSSTELSEFTDLSLKPLAEFWQSADSDTRNILKKFIHLGAQNCAAGILGLIDTEFQLQNETGTSIEGDLLDAFWELEELSSNVNKTT